MAAMTYRTRPKRRGPVLRHGAPARRARPRAALPARAGGPDHDRPDRSEPGVRLHAAAAGGRRGLPGDGRTPRDQDHAHDLRRRASAHAMTTPAPPTTRTRCAVVAMMALR